MRLIRCYHSGMTKDQKKAFRELKKAVIAADRIGELPQFRQLWREYKADGFKTADVTRFALDDMGLWGDRR
jgi:hypothetical protein